MPTRPSQRATFGTWSPGSSGSMWKFGRIVGPPAPSCSDSTTTGVTAPGPSPAFTVASFTVPSTSSVKARLSRASTFALIPCRSVRPVASTSRVTGSWMRSWETSSRNRASCA